MVIHKPSRPDLVGYQSVITEIIYNSEGYSLEHQEFRQYPVLIHLEGALPIIARNVVFQPHELLQLTDPGGTITIEYQHSYSQ